MSVLQNLALVYFENSKYSAALDILLERIIKELSQIDSAENYLTIMDLAARSAYKIDKFEISASLFDDAAKYGSEYGLVSKVGEHYLLAGLNWLEAGMYEKAVKSFSKVKNISDQSINLRGRIFEKYSHC